MRQFQHCTTEHSRLHSCWRMAQNGHHILLNYCRIGVRRPTTSVCKSQRSNQKQMEGSQHWGSSKIHCTMEKRLIAVRKQNGGAIQHIFANRCDWILISCSETCWTYWLFCTFRTPAQYTLLRISLLKQKGISSWFLILFSYDCYFFAWILLSSTTSLQSWGRFLWSIRYARNLINYIHTHKWTRAHGQRAGLRPSWLAYDQPAGLRPARFEPMLVRDGQNGTDKVKTMVFPVGAGHKKLAKIC